MPSTAGNGRQRRRDCRAVRRPSAPPCDRVIWIRKSGARPPRTPADAPGTPRLPRRDARSPTARSAGRLSRGRCTDRAAVADGPARRRRSSTSGRAAVAARSSRSRSSRTAGTLLLSSAASMSSCTRRSSSSIVRGTAAGPGPSVGSVFAVAAAPVQQRDAVDVSDFGQPGRGRVAAPDTGSTVQAMLCAYCDSRSVAVPGEGCCCLPGLRSLCIMEASSRVPPLNVTLDRTPQILVVEDVGVADCRE